jgi:CHC2 zinc finger
LADFQLIKAQVTIEAAAQFLNLELRPMGAALRGPCPACQSGGDRALVVTPSKQLFYCFAAGIGGDLISLWGHIEKCSPADSGRQIADNFGVGNRGTSAPVKTSAPVHNSPSPHKSEAKSRHTPGTPPREFDPAAFASKLQYTDEVSALDISEEDATRLGIGFTRGKLYIALRDEYGFTTGFVAFADGVLKMPPKLLPNPSVVELKRA